MLKSGLIVGIVAILLGAGATLISPLCVPCLGIFLGLAAGFLAGAFDKPTSNNASAKSGALGGAIGAIGTVIGQVIGTIIDAIVVGPEGTIRLLQSMGISTAGQSANATTGYWFGLIGGVC